MFAILDFIERILSYPIDAMREFGKRYPAICLYAICGSILLAILHSCSRG